MNNTRIREINSNFMNTVKYKDVSPVSFANAVVEVSGSAFSHSFRFALDAYHQIVKFLIDGNNFGSIVMSNIGNYAIKKMYVATNPYTSRRAIAIIWYADGIDYTNYIDFTN